MSQGKYEMQTRFSSVERSSFTQDEPRYSSSSSIEHQNLVDSRPNTPQPPNNLLFPPPKPISSYELFVGLVLCLSPFLYGIHIGELNIPQKVITSCPEATPPGEPESFLPPCLNMSDASFSGAVSLFTISGLVGSLVAGKLSDTRGRKKATTIAAISFTIAGLVEALAQNSLQLYAGRLAAGFGSGIECVVVPTYLSEIAPAAHRGFFGTMHQLGIVTGILFTQVLGLSLSYIPGWRILLGIGAIPAILQLLLLPACVDSPRFLAATHRVHDARSALERLRGRYAAQEIDGELAVYRGPSEQGGPGAADYDEEDSLRSRAPTPLSAPTAAGEDRPSGGVPRKDSKSGQVGVTELIMRSEYKWPLVVVLLLHFTQQLSGINGVMYYSTAIMSKPFPEGGQTITVLISLVNVLMTLPSIYLIDRAGRRNLLLGSLGSMCMATFVLAYGIGAGANGLAAFGVVAFVATFAVGVGPVPFIMISEVVDARGVNSAASMALAANWIANFFVGVTFLPLSQKLGESGSGVFVLFAVIQFLALVASWKVIPETRGKSPEAIMTELGGR